MVAMSLLPSSPELGTTGSVEQGGREAKAPLPDLVPPRESLAVSNNNSNYRMGNTCHELGPVHVLNVYFLIRM